MRLKAWRSCLWLAVAASLACSAQGATSRNGAPQCPSAGTQAESFAEIIDGATFRSSSGHEVKLSGVIAPAAGGEVWSDDAAGREAFAVLLGAGPLTVADNTVTDRYGRTLAQVFAGTIWVQGELLRRGLVRASPELAGGVCAKALLQAENQGREAKVGYWADGAFAVLSPDQLRGRVGTFQIVEGKVVSASLNKGRAYINFGADYRTDFTVTVSPADMKLFRQGKFDVKTVSGKRIRVRGWLDVYNGPEMEIATPAAIEVLD